MNPVKIPLIIYNIIEDTADAIDLQQLSDAYDRLTKIDCMSDDDAIKDLAKDFDDAIDLDEALRAYGATGMGIGMVAEMIDGPIWEAAIRRRLRRMGKSKHVMNVSKLHAKLLKRVGR